MQGIDESGVKQVDIADRMESAFLDYAMSVIVSRALPDVRDGLKPVQRRILYAMYEANLHADRPHRKCASVIGDVMKKYHPHGDSSIYEALVRMAQDFSTREPLIDGRGNFGSIDGDSAAAFRYTEARLSPLAMHMLADIDDDTVTYSANYDGHEMAPDILPARFPNLLVNGATGIAVGFSTNIAPHNLGETIAACQMLIANPEATLDEVMTVLPAPDFPTGGRIKRTEGIREAFETGRGAITMEAVAATEVRSGGIPRIVVTEIPYQVNKAKLLSKIADLVKAKKIDTIRDLRDESSRDGMRIVIELKRGEDVQDTLTTLYKLTDLSQNFNVNMVALQQGKPVLLGLLPVLHAYLAHQREVITRRTRYRLDVAKKRLHIIDGLLIALDNIDEVIRTIRESDSTADARTNVQTRFGLSEIQANAVLEMQLRRLARLETSKLQQEQAMLHDLVTKYQAILDDPALLDQVLSAELAAISDQHANPRRSRLVDHDDDVASSIPVLQAQEVTTYVLADGGIKPVAKKAYADAHPLDNDQLVAIVHGPADNTLLCIDEQGGGYFVSPQDAGVLTMKQKAVPLQDIGAEPTSPLSCALTLPELSGYTSDHIDSHNQPEPTLITVSEQGFCKRTYVSEYDVRNRSVQVVAARANDRIVAACISKTETDLLMLSASNGQAIVFPVADIRPTKRATSGVAGMKLASGATIVAATLAAQAGSTDAPNTDFGQNDEESLFYQERSISTVEEPTDIVVIARNGGAKRVPFEAFPIQSRNGKGVLTGVGALAFAGIAPVLHVPTQNQGWIMVRSETLPQMVRSKTPDPHANGSVGMVRAHLCVNEPIE